MSKIIKNNNYNKVEFGSEHAIDLSNFTELNAASGRKGDIGITETGGSYRVVLYSPILDALNNAENVKVLHSENRIAIIEAAPGAPGTYDVRKGGIIYSSDLAEVIMGLVPGVKFKPNSTTRCGRILQVQENKDGTAIVIVCFD